jgi:multicomponent Na+:H+ antiporter subunit E
LTRKWIATGAVLTVLWLLIRGVTTDYLLNELIIGVGIGFGIAYGLRGMYTGETSIVSWLMKIPLMLRYVLNFLKELIAANIDVAKIVVMPTEDIDPEIIEIPLRIENQAAITVLANSITSTPGTLTMDHNPERNSLYVHGITGNTDEEGVLEPIRVWEDMLIEIFDENVEGEEE